jgi:hypothetical protein
MRTTKTRTASVPITLSDLWDEHQQRLPSFTAATVASMEEHLRAIGVEPPPRPEPSPLTAAATEARWKPKRRKRRHGAGSG